MRTTPVVIASVLASLALLVSPRASALTLSADLDTGDCFSSEANKCVGGQYTLDVTNVSGTTYQATLTMNYAGAYDLDIDRDYIMDIDFKVANTYLDPIVVTAAPDSAGNWTPLAGPLNGNGCGGTNDGFICLSAGTNLVIGTSTSLSWTVQFDLASADALLAESDWHIGARFGRINPANGREQTSLLSASTAPIPEPTSVLLFGAGALIVAVAARRHSA